MILEVYFLKHINISKSNVGKMADGQSTGSKKMILEASFHSDSVVFDGQNVERKFSMSVALPIIRFLHFGHLNGSSLDLQDSQMWWPLLHWKIRLGGDITCGGERLMLSTAPLIMFLTS